MQPRISRHLHSPGQTGFKLFPPLMQQQYACLKFKAQTTRSVQCMQAKPPRTASPHCHPRHSDPSIIFCIKNARLRSRRNHQKETILTYTRGAALLEPELRATRQQQYPLERKGRKLKPPLPTSSSVLGDILRETGSKNGMKLVESVREHFLTGHHLVMFKYGGRIRLPC